VLAIGQYDLDDLPERQAFDVLDEEQRPGHEANGLALPGEQAYGL
jgi:hypothetical protein